MSLNSYLLIVLQESPHNITAEPSDANISSVLCKRIDDGSIVGLVNVPFDDKIIYSVRMYDFLLQIS